MPWTPDAKSAAVLEQLITCARTRACREFRQACHQIGREPAAQTRPLGYRCLVKAMTIVRAFGQVTVLELVAALREMSGGSIPLETLGWVGLVLTKEIQELVKTLAGQMDGVTNAHLKGAVERLQGAGGDATREVERQLGKAALWAPAGDGRARHSQ
jgi:hypothetical protein